MSCQHNEKEFEKIMQEVEELDQQGMLEEDVQTVCRVYGLHEDDDRDDPFDSDVTSEEDDDDLMPERIDPRDEEVKVPAASQQRESDVDQLINEEL